MPPSYLESFVDIEDILFQKALSFQMFFQKQNQKFKDRIEHHFLKWKHTYFLNQNVTISSLNRVLNIEEQGEFKKILHRYISQIQSSNVWTHRLKKLSLRVYVPVFTVLITLIQHELELVSDKDLNQLKHFLYLQYVSTLSLSGYAIYHSFKKLAPIFSVSELEFSRIFLSRSGLDNMTLEERFNHEKTYFMLSMQLSLKQSIARGESTASIFQNVVSKVDQREVVYNRLLRTENEKVISNSFKDILKQYKIDKYVFVATIDKRTSQICMSYHEKVFSVTDYEIGVTAPPMHPNCRSIISPLLTDSFVSPKASSMSYMEWKETYLR